MVADVQELLDLIDLRRIGQDAMQGRAVSTTLQRIFGGHVLAQALCAASMTARDGRSPHSLHGYFLRPGDPSEAIVYRVERVRDGRSFSVRQVAATQADGPIFVMTASFQTPERGLEHQVPMPDAPSPANVPSLRDHLQSTRAEMVNEWAALDVRFVMEAGNAQRVWLRAAGRLPDDPIVHACVLAYASDMTLLGVALRPHGIGFEHPGLSSASIDHAMWFHRAARVDDWILYDQESPSTSSGRGLATGRMFTADGSLVATVVQEGLMRVRAD